MTIASDTLGHYPDASPVVRKRLADAIAAAQASQESAAKPATKPADKGAVPTGAKASEGSFAAQDAVLAEFEGLPAHHILAAMSERIVLSEGVDLDEAMRLVAERFPKVAERFLTEVPPDVALAAHAHALVLSEGIPYGTAMARAAENDPELAKRYHEANFGAPDATPRAERPDVQLAERAKARAERDGLDFGAAMHLELSEDTALADAYARRSDTDERNPR